MTCVYHMVCIEAMWRHYHFSVHTCGKDRCGMFLIDCQARSGMLYIHKLVMACSAILRWTFNMGSFFDILQPDWKKNRKESRVYEHCWFLWKSADIPIRSIYVYIHSQKPSLITTQSKISMSKSYHILQIFLLKLNLECMYVCTGIRQYCGNFRTFYDQSQFVISWFKVSF